MTIFICYAIAMVIVYMMELLDGGFDVTELCSFLVMMLLLGAHVYLSTRKKAIFGIVVPVIIVVSFYPVCELLNPANTTLITLVGLYVVTLGGFLYIWYRARKTGE